MSRRSNASSPAQDATRSGNGSVTQDATPSEREEIALRHAQLEAEIAASLKSLHYYASTSGKRASIATAGAGRRNSWRQLSRRRRRSPLRDASV